MQINMNNLRIQAVNACNSLVNKLNMLHIQKERYVSIDLIKEEIQELRNFVGIMLCIADEKDELFKDLTDVEINELALED